MKLLLLLSVYLVYVVRAQLVVQGKCPDLPDLATPLNKEKMSGIWYVYKTYPNPYDHDMKCSDDLMEPFDGKGLSGTFHFLNTTSNTKGTGTYVASNIEGANGKFNTTFTGRDGDVKLIYAFVAVDYDNFHIGWSCTENEEASYRLLWVETRSRTVSDKVQEKIQKSFEKLNLDASKLITVDQTNCDA